METESSNAVRAARVAYVIDPALSRFSVQGFAGGFLSTFAHNPKIAIRDFAGKAELTPETIEPASLRIVVKAGSLELTDNVSDRDRREIERVMREEVLEVEKYPEIVYESSGVSATTTGAGQYAINLQGSLSLHGVTRPHTLAANLVLTGDRLHVYGDFSLNQTDYQIKLVRVAGGAIRLKDELKFSFDLVGHKQG
jgi:polyisoprenoid-binding protein YceI